jgi:hypothetical protein
MKLTVNHGATLADLIAACNFARMLEEVYVKYGNILFPIERQDIVKAEFEVFPSPHEHTSTIQALTIINRSGMRPANIREILTYTANIEGRLPDIVALGSIIQIEKQRAEVPSVGSDITGRLLATAYTCDRFAKTTGFLGVKEL